MTRALLKKAIKFEEVALTSAQMRELDRRVDLMKKNPNRGIPWNEAKCNILKLRFSYLEEAID